MRGRSWWIGLILAVGACSDRAEIVRGETVILVDTDLPVPDVVARARVDVFAEDGRWIGSRDVLAGDKTEWPFSFGIAAGERPERRLVRVRVFPEHQMRDYRGARPALALAGADDPLPADTLAEMCTSQPELLLGGETTIRIGTVPFTTPNDVGACKLEDGSPMKVRGGAAAARVEIAEQGSYRFELTRMLPLGHAVILLLRRDCADAASELGCSFLPTGGALDAIDLSPGTYSIVAASTVPLQPAEVTIRVKREGSSDSPAPTSALPAEGPVREAEPPAWPRLFEGARDVTPLAEPREEVAADVLAFVDVVPGERRTVRVSADGACLAKAADVQALDERRIDIASAQGCVAGETAPTPAAPRDEDRAPTRAGTFFTPAPCAPTQPTRVCVPGGMFVMGSELFGGTGLGSTTPERVVAIETFYVDRDEFSVGDYRAAVVDGHPISGVTYLRKNDGALEPSSTERNALCTFSTDPREREDHPLNCVTWPGARALCEKRGGDLPTEAMWEYMARKAGKSSTTLYPWGDDDPSCERAVHDRLGAGLQGRGSCERAPGGPTPQPRAASANDVNPLGIRGLGGSIGEWCRDAFAPYEHECWRRSSIVNPWCELAFAPMRSVRGGDWSLAPQLLASALRDASGAMTLSMTIGFRCVYGAP